MTVLCVVAATRMSFNAAKKLSSEGHLEVLIMINKLSDTSNLFQYGLRGGAKEILGIADLDDLEMLKNCASSSSPATIAQTLLVRVGDCYQTFRIDNLNDYNMFNDLVSECRMLSEMTLRLDCLTRDIYFAGVYSTCEIEGGGVLLSEMLLKIQNQQKDPSEFQIFDISSRMSSYGDKLNSKSAPLESNAITTQHHIMSEINCVFCGAQKMTEISRDFTIHPYVSATFEKKHIYMCIPCVHNWKQFREKAIVDNQLVLKDEINEELCGKCVGDLFLPRDVSIANRWKH